LGAESHIVPALPRALQQQSRRRRAAELVCRSEPGGDATHDMRNASTRGRTLRNSETLGDNLGKAARDAANVLAPVRLAPVDDRIAHAKHGQHGKPCVRARGDAAVVDAGLDHLLEAALDAPALAPDTLAARVGQIAALVDEYAHVVRHRLD